MAVIVVLALLGIFILSFGFLFFRSGPKSSLPPPGETALKNTASTYTAAEVKKHNSRDDCWIILKDKVYDVTSYVEEHPGGDSILNNAGGDSTEGFYGPQHVSRVFEMIGDYYIGDLQP